MLRALIEVASSSGPAGLGDQVAPLDQGPPPQRRGSVPTGRLCRWAVTAELLRDLRQCQVRPFCWALHTGLGLWEAGCTEGMPLCHAPLVARRPPRKAVAMWFVKIEALERR